MVSHCDLSLCFDHWTIFLASPISFTCRGLEVVNLERVVILSGVVEIHLAVQFISIYILCTHSFICLSGIIKINWFGLQSPSFFPLFFKNHVFLWFLLDSLLEEAKLIQTRLSAAGEKIIVVCLTMCDNCYQWKIMHFHIVQCKSLEPPPHFFVFSFDIATSTVHFQSTAGE